MMTRTPIFRSMASAMALSAVALPAGTLAAQAGSPPPGRIETLPTGTYECTLPGDAAGPAWHRVPEADFTILNASSYEAQGQRGVYLLRGGRVIFTRGPMKGTMMERAGRRMLRALDENGTPGRLRCVRTGAAT